MTPPSRRFDGYLSSINSDKLKPMMRLWGASTQLRKDDCIAVIREGLADPAKVKAALSTLTALEVNALALVKTAGRGCWNSPTPQGAMRLHQVWRVRPSATVSCW